MNEQDKKILDLYLKSIRKKRIIVFFIIVILIFLAISVFFYLDYRKNENKIESEFDIIEENIQNITTDEMIDNNITIENTTSQTDNSIANETTENSQNNIINEIQSENISTDNSNVENDQDTNTNEETTSASISQKTANKDFLFADGYTMENVSQAAQDYLNSFSGYSGECIPIQDDEGIYLGMRVIFY